MFSIDLPHRKSRHPCSRLWRSIRHKASSFYHYLFYVHPLLIQLCYFSIISTVGFLILKIMKPRTTKIKNLDLFFMSVSSATVSSMSTIDLERFSNAQLIIIIIMMLLGGEVFLSMVGLYLSTSYFQKPTKTKGGAESPATTKTNDVTLVDMGIVRKYSELEISQNQHETATQQAKVLKYNSLKTLVLIVMGYMTVIQLLGTALVLAYMSTVTTAREVLEKKGIPILTYAIFTVISSFSSCGFTPNDENMFAFRKHSGLLLILMPQILLGNTLYAPCLRLLIWLLQKILKKNEIEYLLKTDVKEIGYDHLLPRMHSRLLPITVFGFIGVQLLLFCAMEWNLGEMSGLNGYQKFVGALFQCVNTRHTGESVMNIANIAHAILVLFIVMMYLPPYTSFLPPKYDQGSEPQVADSKQMTRRTEIIEDVLFSQVGYLVGFIIAICITERKSMVEDPLNFNVLYITLEVVSAYGNVGFSAGYNCGKRLNHEGICLDKWHGFAGRWTSQGKIILIIVMFFGRLKKFNMQGGKAWKIE
ncbi:hypothetical protein Droror1_Dr00006742 [Drosera rotundifolia]